MTRRRARGPAARPPDVPSDRPRVVAPSLTEHERDRSRPGGPQRGRRARRGRDGGAGRPGVPVDGAGGLSGGRLGTNGLEVADALRRVLAANGRDGVARAAGPGQRGDGRGPGARRAGSRGRALVRLTEAPIRRGRGPGGRGRRGRRRHGRGGGGRRARLHPAQAAARLTHGQRGPRPRPVGHGHDRDRSLAALHRPRGPRAAPVADRAGRGHRRRGPRHQPGPGVRGAPRRPARPVRIPTDDAGALLTSAGRRLLGLVGGASGALYGRALMTAGTRLSRAGGHADGRARLDRPAGARGDRAGGRHRRDHRAGPRRPRRQDHAGCAGSGPGRAASRCARRPRAGRAARDGRGPPRRAPRPRSRWSPARAAPATSGSVRPATSTRAPRRAPSSSAASRTP